MKQQINLYQIEKRKFVWDLTYQYTIWLLLAFVGILVVITVVDTMKNFSDKSKLTQLENEHNSKSKALQTISGQVPEERTREQLANEIKKYQTEKQAKQEILDSLVAQMSRVNQFSGYLEALSQKTVSGLWFTKLNFTENGNVLSLEGKALKPEYLPNFIQKLSKDPAFGGKKFHVFKETLDDKTQEINFVLQTKSVKKP